MNTRFSFRFAAPLALAVSLATLAPAFAAGDNNSDQPVTDTWITTKVKSELATTDGVKSMDVDVKTVPELIALAKARPGKLDCSSTGIGTVQHVSLELLNHMAGIRCNP